MSDNEIQGVKTAALLHDIGKLAVPEHILSKPGPLTQEEFQKIRIHPQVGAEIISAVPFPYPVAPLILSHHERWDGKGYPQGLKGEEIPLGARILSVVDYFDALTSDRPYHKAMTPRRGARAAAAGSRPRARSARSCRCSSKMLPDMAERRRHLETAHAAPPVARADQRARPARPSAFQPEAIKGSTVFEDIALAHREIYALYEIAQTMGTSLGVADTMALISSKLIEPRAVLGLRAVPLRRARRHAALPLRDRRRSRRDRHDDRCAPARASPAGSRATAGRSSTRARARTSRPPASSQPTALQSALVAPLVFNDRFIGTLAVYHDAARLLHRRSPPPARSRLRTGVGRDPQLDRVRADAGRLADRSADRPAEHALHVHAPDARAGARRAAEGRGRAARHGPRQLQGDQRQPRPPRRRPRAARGRRACCAPASARTTSASATPATSSSSCCPAAAPKKPSASGSSCSGRSTTWCSRRGPAAACRSRSASARRSSRTTATPTKRCWPPPTAACIATRPAASSACRCSRRDRHRRPAGRHRPAATRPPEITEIEIQRAGFGVL